MTRGRVLAAWLVLVACAAAYEGAIALGIVGIGDAPGEGAPAQGLIGGVGMAALLAGGIALLAGGRGGGVRDLPGVWLAPLAGHAFLVAVLASYDPYYAPALRRVGADGVAPAFVAVLGVLALVAALLLRPGRATRRGEIAGGALLLMAFWALVGGGGH